MHLNLYLSLLLCKAVIQFSYLQAKKLQKFKVYPFWWMFAHLKCTFDIFLSFLLLIFLSIKISGFFPSSTIFFSLKYIFVDIRNLRIVFPDRQIL